MDREEEEEAMIRWEDLLGEPQSEPSPEPLTRSLEEIKEASAGRLSMAMGVPRELLETKPPQAEPISDSWATPAVREPTWRLADEEPPDSVIRLAPVEPAGGFELPNYARMHLARIPRTPRGEPRGWWWIPQHLAAPDAEGWPWRRTSPNPLDRYQFRRAFPMLESRTSGLTVSLVKALPHDDNWYQIGVFRDGTPVWAWIDSHDEFEVMILDHDPGEDE